LECIALRYVVITLDARKCLCKPATHSVWSVIYFVRQSCQREEITVLEGLPASHVSAASCWESLHCKGLSNVSNCFLCQWCKIMCSTVRVSEYTYAYGVYLYGI